SDDFAIATGVHRPFATVAAASPPACITVAHRAAAQRAAAPPPVAPPPPGDLLSSPTSTLRARYQTTTQACRPSPATDHDAHRPIGGGVNRSFSCPAPLRPP